MAKRIAKNPSYRKHRATKLAVVTLSGHDYYLGPHGSATSLREYDRLIAEWLANGLSMRGVTESCLVNELILGFYKFNQAKAGSPQSKAKQLNEIRCAMRPLKRLYGDTELSDFGPRSLMTVREQFIDAGLSRKTVNARTGLIRRVFRWAVREELVSPTVFHGLQSVGGLKAGESVAPNPKKVHPVDDQFVDAIRPFVSKQVWGLIELQRLTGLRPGEALSMRGCDLDLTGKLWLFRPSVHKTQHFGHERIVEIGPKAQAIIRPFLKVDLARHLFSPKDSEIERREVMHAKRVTPMSCGNRPGSNKLRRAKRKPHDCYCSDSYRRAITRACDQADKAAKLKRKLPEDSERVIPRWHPYQLRHNFATMVRKEYGLEMARILCGHKSMVVTEVYGEFDRSKARHVVEKIG